MNIYNNLCRYLWKEEIAPNIVISYAYIENHLVHLRNSLSVKVDNI